jgi:hypothetical protein
VLVVLPSWKALFRSNAARHLPDSIGSRSSRILAWFAGAAPTSLCLEQFHRALGRVIYLIRGGVIGEIY